MVCSYACHGAMVQCCQVLCQRFSDLTGGGRAFEAFAALSLPCGNPGNLAASLPLDSSFGTYGTVLRQNRKNFEQTRNIIETCNKQFDCRKSGPDLYILRYTYLPVAELSHTAPGHHSTSSGRQIHDSTRQACSPVINEAK